MKDKSAGLARSLAISAAALAVVLGGCSNGVSSLNPFGGGGVSDVETVFLAAAGSWDRNHDGIVTCDEWKAYAAELFDSADAGHKGFVSTDEFATIIKTDRMFETADFKYWDANHDGKVTRAEFVDRPNPAFALLDKKKECALTSTELAGGRNLLVQKKPLVGPPPDTQTQTRPGR